MIDTALRVLAEARSDTGKKIIFAVLSPKNTVFPVLPPGLHRFDLEDGRVVLNLIYGDVEDAFESLLVCGEPVLEKTLRTWHVDTWFVADDLSERMRAIIAMLSGSDSGHKLTPIKPTTPWHVAPKIKSQKKAAVVIGAGLAGCFTAHALAKRGWQVRVLDSNAEVAMGASGNRHAVLYPNLSAYPSPLTTWMLHAFLYAAPTYASWLKAGKIKGEQNGILQCAVTDKMRASHATLLPWLANYPTLGQFLSPEQASQLAGVDLNQEALWVPLAGWFDIRALCEFLLDAPGITWEPNTHVTNLEFDEPIVILANGGAARDFPQTEDLPLSMVRGKLTAIASNTRSSALKLPLCGAGHVLPKDAEGHHWFGASYGEAHAAEHEENLAKLARLPVAHHVHDQALWSNTVTDAWTGHRAKTLDHVPLVGSVPHVEKFKQQFAKLALDGGKFLPHAGEYWPGLYVCAGFGSRGLTSIPLAAEYLAAHISGEPTSLSRNLAQAIAPARFLVKALKRGLHCE
ncbi:MAG: FAD-dependent 5-carboxymethylaminomethyl-2-thiouridine(34) oxidoreductase MnmC [Legionellaceae bacterium]|nr:FAD-dependent 5-carboxymethylaminomethyl-2-thiouridine(34) oxidoreductase MnmC [Legionellaceae bacterium]